MDIHKDRLHSVLPYPFPITWEDRVDTLLGDISRRGTEPLSVVEEHYNFLLENARVALHDATVRLISPECLSKLEGEVSPLILKAFIHIVAVESLDEANAASFQETANGFATQVFMRAGECAPSFANAVAREMAKVSFSDDLETQMLSIKDKHLVSLGVSVG